MSEPLLEVRNLKKYFQTNRGLLCAVDNVSIGDDISILAHYDTASGRCSV